jgi:hypothetical protein
MACNSCQSTKSIPQCTGQVVIGTYTANTDIFIFVKNNTTGYIHRQESTTDSDGKVLLDLSFPDPSFYNHDNTYELWINEPGSSQNIQASVSIGDEEYLCFNLLFNPLYNEDDESISYTQHTLEIE